MEIVLSAEAFSKAQKRLEKTFREASREKNATESNLPSCPICACIVKISTFGPRPVEMLLGKWEDIMLLECPNHGDLLPPNHTMFQRDIFLRKPQSKNQIYMHPDPYRTKTIYTIPWEAFEPSESPTLFSGENDHCHVRIVDNSWIDFNLLKSWVSECEKSHKKCGNVANFEFSSSGGPSILVDVAQKCLVLGNAKSRYVALSYVWGDVNNFLTTRSKLKQLLEPGALASNGAVDHIPRTVQQAMDLTRALGERCLWVDALCIVQDGKDKTLQLDGMASIYENALFTIVNAEGKDADAGFRGLQGISTERHIKQLVVSPLPQLRLVKPSSKQVWSGTLLAPWSTRAWTFQEEICSRRTLYFAHDSVRWVCREAHWSEESDSVDCLRTYANAEQRLFASLSSRNLEFPASTLPQLDELRWLVNGFNCRALTYPEDALSAFAGVCTRLSTKFEGGMISGLPELFFDICLLWQPQRRLAIASQRRMKTGSSHCILPSWSWAGWITEITWPYTWNLTLDIPTPYPVMMQNIRPFYQIDLFYIDNQGLKYPISNSWSSFGRSALDGDLTVPWQRHKARNSPQDYGKIKQYYFTHESDPSIRFWFPVPICNRLELPKMIKLIEFRTTVGKFRLGETRRTITRLHSLDGTLAGVLWQHDETDEDFIHAKMGEMGDRKPIELVAILGSIIPRDDGYLWDASEVSLTMFGEADEPSRTREVYNVIWIEWQGDVAYRKATGEVDKEIWENSVLEWKNVRLG